jgi:hypothetical protein
LRAALADSAATASETTSPSDTAASESRSAPEVIRESWNRSSTMLASRSVSLPIRRAYSPVSAGSLTTPSASASDIARIPASGVRRSWLIQVTSSRRADSAARSRSRASRSQTLSLASPRPSSSPAGTETAVTTRHTATVARSCGSSMNPATPSTPTSAAITGMSTSTVTAAMIE